MVDGLGDWDGGLVSCRKLKLYILAPSRDHNVPFQVPLMFLGYVMFMICSVIVLVMKSYCVIVWLWRATSPISLHRAYYPTKIKILLIIFLFLGGVTSRKNAKFRGFTYVPVNGPTWASLSQYTRMKSVFLPKINIFLVWDIFLYI